MRGRLQVILKRLPFGLPDWKSHTGPDGNGANRAHKSKSKSLPNLEVLTSFVTRPPHPAGAATAVYTNADGQIETLVQLALVAPQKSVAVQKPTSTKRRFRFGKKKAVLRFEIKPRKRTIQGKGKCRLFDVTGLLAFDEANELEQKAAAEMSQKLRYLVLAGRRKNLYLEIAVTQSGGPTGKKPLTRLRKAARALKLDICHPPEN